VEVICEARLPGYHQERGGIYGDVRGGELASRPAAEHRSRGFFAQQRSMQSAYGAGHVGGIGRWAVLLKICQQSKSPPAKRVVNLGSHSLHAIGVILQLLVVRSLPAEDLPQHQPEGVHIRSLCVDVSLEDLRGGPIEQQSAALLVAAELC
jgi:hypothetical protein